MALPVFKTEVPEDLGQAGSIPVRLRHPTCGNADLTDRGGAPRPGGRPTAARTAYAEGVEGSAREDGGTASCVRRRDGGGDTALAGTSGSRPPRRPGSPRSRWPAPAGTGPGLGTGRGFAVEEGTRPHGVPWRKWCNRTAPRRRRSSP